MVETLIFAAPIEYGLVFVLFRSATSARSKQNRKSLLRKMTVMG